MVYPFCEYDLKGVPQSKNSDKKHNIVCFHFYEQILEHLDMLEARMCAKRYFGRRIR